MKNPLHYQLSEYDCGPTAMLNAVSFLFRREDIPPELVRNIMLYCLDCYDKKGCPGKSGTSRAAMMFLSNWLNGFGRIGQLPISSRYLAGDQVYIGGESLINDTLCRGGAVVVRLFLDEWHYVTFTGVKDKEIYLFDPYYLDKPFPQKDILVTRDHPFRYNCVVPFSYFTREDLELYALGPVEAREAVLLYNQETVQTADKTIEYFI